MKNLATEFHRQGHEVQLLTARWDSRWARRETLQGVPVRRLRQSSLRQLGTLQYTVGLCWWLWRHRKQFDVVYVSMLKHDAYAALMTLGNRLPVILRAEGGGDTGDCRWQEENPYGPMIQKKCQKAPALVAPSPTISNELFESGYEISKIHFVPNGVELNRHVVQALRKEDPRYPTSWKKLQALKQTMRERLASDYPIMAIPSHCQLAVFTGRLHRNKGLGDLIRAWRMVVTKLRNARLWIVGSGEYEPILRQLIVQHDLQGLVQLTGAMPRVDRILAAADLFILPSYEEGMSMALLEAMASRLPVIVSDIPGNRDLIEHERHGIRVPLRKEEKLATAISNILNRRELADELGKNALDRIQKKYSISRIAQRHHEIFARAIAEFQAERKAKESSQRSSKKSSKK